MPKHQRVVLSKEDGIPEITVVINGVPYQLVLILEDDQLNGMAINLHDATASPVHTSMGSRRPGDTWLSLWNALLFATGGRLRAMDDVKQGRDIGKKYGRDVSRW